MIQQHQTDTYIKICMKAWLLCESCVHAENTSAHARPDLVDECGQCAKTCFAVVSKLVSDTDDLGDLALNCILHCRQCADICYRYDENDILLCGEVCSTCAEMLKQLVPMSLN